MRKPNPLPVRGSPIKPWEIPPLGPAKLGAHGAIDIHIGERIQMRRNYRNMSVTALAAACGVSGWQVRKWEQGTNRIPAARIYHVGVALDCHPGVFYDGFGTLNLSGPRISESSEVIPTLTPTDLRRLIGFRRMSKAQLMSVDLILEGFAALTAAKEAQIAEGEADIEIKRIG